MLAHFGQNLHHADVLVSSGFEVHSFGLSLEELEQALRGIEFDAAIITCDERGLAEGAIHVVRSVSGAPIIVFEGVTDCAGLPCDLIVPKLTHPSKWLPRLERLISEARELRIKTIALRTDAQYLRQEAAKLRGEATELRERSSDNRKKAEHRIANAPKRDIR